VENGKNKLAMVTGGSGGIGFELARQFADNGFDVAISGQSGHRQPDDPRAGQGREAGRAHPSQVILYRL
jgi:NAD(P)-dependent dehydrogenase (short-subunit alcohol dehydrogenase family)